MPSRSISKVALKAMAIRLFIVVLLSSLGGYWYNYKVFKDNAVHELEKYSQERAERESLRFRFTEKNLKLLGSAFHQKILSHNYDIEKEFSENISYQKDGTYRQKNRSHDYQTQIFIEKGVTPDAEMKRNLVIADHLLNNFGYAWSSMFIDVWLVSSKGYAALFWPGPPNILSRAPTNFSFSEQEWVQIGLPQNNPDQKTSWSDPYFDQLTGEWVITANYPFYFEDEYQFSLAMDVQLSALQRRTMKNSLPNTHHIIFNENGSIIVKPDEEEKPEKALNDIVRLVKSSNETIIYDDKNDLILAKRKIIGPDWWFVVVYPEINLISIARTTGAFVALVGLISLLIELLMLYLVIQKYVTHPIQKLIEATSRIARGDIRARVEIDTHDEIGSLASSFNVMGDKIMERDHKLIEQAEVLESQVKERTSELDTQRAKAYQAAKMATLGEMAGGIAHEINNPLAVISMSTESLTKQIKAKTLSDEKLLAYAERVQRTTERISRVVKGMKSFSRDAGSDPKKSTSVEQIINNTLTLCEQTLESSDIYLTLSDVPQVRVYCREIEIIQALMNLIQNSIDALEKKEQKNIDIKTKIVGKMVHICVEDSGPRMPDAVVDRLMTPFFTTKDVGKGVGLGLFTSNGLVKSNGGKLYLDRSSPHTKFVIELPIEITH